MGRKLTLEDVVEVIQAFSENVDKRFETIDERFEAIDMKFEAVDKRFDEIDKQFKAIDIRFDGIEGRLGNVEKSMVTKEYLDEKMTELRFDMNVHYKKNDKKFTALVDELSKRNVIPVSAAKRILAIDSYS